MKYSLFVLNNSLIVMFCYLIVLVNSELRLSITRLEVLLKLSSYVFTISIRVQCFDIYTKLGFILCLIVLVGIEDI